MHFEHVTCPHCGILCDDLSVEVKDSSINLVNVDHPHCQKPFTQAQLLDDHAPSAMVMAKDASMQEAINKASDILRHASQPLVSGLIADVQACREALALTEKIGGVIDHANGPSMRANVAVMQRVGKVKTTLAEARNRGDNIIIFGSGMMEKFPRFMERILLPAKSLGSSSTTHKNITIIDSQSETPGQCFQHSSIKHLKFNTPDLETIVQNLELMIHAPDALDKDDTDIQALRAVYEKILNSQYTVIVWSTSLFKLASAEQTVQSITQSIKTLMKTVRCVGLPLGGSKAEITATQVATWQTGVPLPVAFTGGIPVHDPVRYSGDTMISNKEADALVWISTYSADDIPPVTDIPTIVIGHPRMELNADIAVYIPVGIPGIDTRGLACRTDSVATLPLQKIRHSDLATASDVLNKINQTL